jgi:hypothetical protein
LRSLADELNAQSNRVRDLIGDRHWSSDGNHKEFLLAESLRRHLPGSHVIAKGFVVHPTRSEICSREQDLLVMDITSEAPVFHQGGVAVVFPAAVRAAISVKTTLAKKEALDSVGVLASARDVAVQAGTDPTRIWCGAFFFRSNDVVLNRPATAYSYLEDAVRETYSMDFTTRHGGPDVIATADDLLFRLYRNDDESAKLVGFNCGGLSSAVFVAHLLDHLATMRGSVRSDFADFADAPSIQRLEGDDHTFKLS